MTSTLTPRHIASAVVAGAAGAAYYATPDFIASRTARGWTKVGISAVLVATSIPDFLELRDERREKKALEWKAAQQEPGDDGTAAVDEETPISTRGKVALGGIAVGLLAGSVVLTVLAEKWIYRRGEARAAAGKSFAHSRIALLFGALTTALALLPSPQDDE